MYKKDTAPEATTNGGLYRVDWHRGYDLDKLSRNYWIP